jgi:hypothetical protein
MRKSPEPPAPPPALASPAPPAAQPSKRAPAAPLVVASGTGDGAITVVCSPRCDQIIDNGVALGPGHIFNRPAAAGRHVFVLSAPNGVKKTLTVDVFPSSIREVRISMAGGRPPEHRSPDEPASDETPAPSPLAPDSLGVRF